MPHLQLTDTTARRAHQQAVTRCQLQHAHASAVQRANLIAAREPGVISIYALGDVIAQIEADQLDHGKHLELTESITLHRVIRRLKDLLPKH